MIHGVKAFFKSRDIIPFRRLLSIFHSHSFAASSKAVSVEKIGLTLGQTRTKLYTLFRTER